MTNIPATKPNIITLHSASTSLGLRQAELTEYLTQGDIQKVKNSRGKWAITVDDFKKLKTLIAENSKIKPVDVDEEGIYRKAVTKLKKELSQNVQISLRERTTTPHKAILFVGPTNSGKTYHALEELFRDYEMNPDKQHVYCGPLRLLAYEVYLKMVDRFGKENVGFITGEEQINPHAKIVATTAEMAPMEGGSILIDEAHWVVDEDRGHVWTRLLHGAEYENMYVVTAGEAVDLIKKLTDQAWYSETRTFTRKTPIKFGGTISLKSLPPRTAVVCFSRKNVYAVAAAIQKSGTSVGVLYGALPLEVRKKQIDDYLTGKYDVMVVTDVIGHGINLPIDNVVFTEVEKFDGKESRNLHTWEGAQISGRAGRFGLSEQGNVYLAEGLPWFETDTSLLREFVSAAGGKTATDLEADTAFFAPKFQDLGLQENTPYTASKMLPAVYQWQKKFTDTVLIEHADCSLLVDEQKNILRILEAIGLPSSPWSEYKMLPESSYPNFEVSVQELWQLSSGPFTSTLPTLESISKWLVSPYREDSPLLEQFFKEHVTPAVEATRKPYNSLETHMLMLEKTLQIVAELKMAFVMFGHEGQQNLGTLKLDDVLNAEAVLVAGIMRKLSLNVKQSKAGTCSKCYKVINPHRASCEQCKTT